jgi:hypothetical protein
VETFAALWWTPGFLQRFESEHGYDPTKFLPLMFHPSNAFRNYKYIQPYNTTYVLDPLGSDQSRYLQDYRATLSNCYEEYLAGLRDWSRSLGLSHSAEVAYNLPLDLVRSYLIN